MFDFHVLDMVEFGELVQFDNGSKGLVLSIEKEHISVVIFGNVIDIKERFILNGKQ